MIKKIYLGLILFFASFFVGHFALATTIFSPLLELEANPGESLQGVVKVYNETKDNLLLVSSIEPFTAGDEAGRPVYLPAEAQDYYLDWFELSQEDILLKPGQVAIVPFTVTIPDQATPGGYYAVIFWGNVPEQAANKPAVGVNSKVGTLIFLKVKGLLTEQGTTEFFIKENKNLFFRLPVHFVVRFINQGNIHLKPIGKIELTNWFGKKEIIEINPTKRNVLPDSARQFELIWGSSAATGNILERSWNQAREEFNHLSFGKYKASLYLKYGIDNEQEFNQEIEFWVIPVHLFSFLIIIIIIFIVFLKINSKVKRLKNSNVQTGTTK